MAQEDLAHRLLSWYGQHAREFPWRAAPGSNPDPYHVWLSEVMLQQTSVVTVKAYYERFLKLWPRVGDLAEAPLDDVLRAWAGLGYYARARNLHACAQKVAFEHGGRFPDTEEGLRKLPGVGAYTAGAIAAIAFGRRAAAVDGNVERVMSRLYAIATPLPAAKAEIHAKTLALVPDAAPGDFAQALMDLGSTVCVPKRPNCLICPWSEDCRGRLLADTLPRKQAKPPIPTRRGIAFWLEREDGSVLLRRRPERGLLGGMMEIPSTAWLEEGTGEPPDPHTQAPFDVIWAKTGAQIAHTFTHFHLELEIWKAKLATAEPPTGDYRWVLPDALAAEALPTVMRKIVAKMLP